MTAMKRRVTFILLSLMLLLAAGLCFCSVHAGWFGGRRYESIEERAEQAQKYAARKGMSTNYCVLVDYGIPSGSPRVFVWSFAEGKVVYRGHAMHGPGKGSTAETPVFSNVPGSHCSSVGRFEVTRRHGNRNKTGYYLRGLDRTNSRAYSRGIMIHSSKWVDRNAWRRYIPLNARSCLGCVTVSTRDMRYIGRLVEKEDRRLLLWAYCDAAEGKAVTDSGKRHI